LKVGREEVPLACFGSRVQVPLIWTSSEQVLPFQVSERHAAVAVRGSACGLLLASCSGMKWPCSGPNAPSAVPSTSNRRSSACRALAYCGGWRRCACLDAKTRVLAIRALASSTTCNNFIADLLFLSEVPHSLLVAAPRCVLRAAAAAAPAAACSGCGLRPAGCGLRGWGRGRCGAAPAFGAGLRRKQKAESRASGSGTSLI
jgi:hypothetical protein